MPVLILPIFKTGIPFILKESLLNAKPPMTEAISPNR